VLFEPGNLKYPRYQLDEFMQSAYINLEFQMFKQSLTMKSWKDAGKAETCPCFKGDSQNLKKNWPACLFLIMCLQRHGRALGATFHFQSTNSCLSCLGGSPYSKTQSSFRCKRRAMTLFWPSGLFISFELKMYYTVFEIK